MHGHIRNLAQVSASMGLGSARAKAPEEVMSAALNELLAGRADRFPRSPRPSPTPEPMPPPATGQGSSDWNGSWTAWRPI
ncbi:hypothetical protein O1L68_27235 [Streptomyces lydicus]|nr:hypothetical protein [Streptomyces lydicus]